MTARARSPSSSSDSCDALSRSERIAAALLEDILVGQYRAGERLPSERDLAARFAAGRGSVREALKRLEQLGVASIQPGGARAVPVEQCTLDVLGPLLDLEAIPDADLVDQVLEVFGALLELAASAAIMKATDADIERAQAVVAELETSETDHAREHAALRGLAELLIDVADHLVLRLTLNGLRTTFFARMWASGVSPPRPDADARVKLAGKLRRALDRRDAAALARAMHELNVLLRTTTRSVLTRRKRKDEGR